MSMRAMLTTSINFGLVNVPVKMYAATSSHDVKFTTFHAETHEPIGQRWYGKESGADIDYADTVKGIAVDGTLVTVSKDELAGLEEDAGKAIEVIQFAPADQVNPIMLENPYYLAPSTAKDNEGYTLLREVMGQTDRVAIVRYTTRGKTHMAVLRVAGAVITLQNLAWADEVREPEFATIRPVNVNPKMLAVAEMLVESMHGDFDPADFTDTYTERLTELVAAKAEGGELAPVEREAAEDVADLLAALEASVARHPAGKGKGKKAKSA